MFGWDDSQQAYQQTYDDGQPREHEGKLSHEVLAGGAAFAGFKAFEDHQRNEGQQVNHAFAKELLAGFAGAEADKLVETKGEDFYDRERVQHEAKRNAENMYDDHYGGQDGYDPAYSPPQHLQNEFQNNNW